MIRIFIAVLLILAGVVHSTSAEAHAALIRSDPVDGSLLDSPPSQIVLTFNEPVSLIDVHFTDPSGRNATASDVHMHGDALMARLPAGLAQGTVLVSWRVVSADGHPINGAFAFSVGRVSAGTSAATVSVDRVVSVGLWAAGALFLAGLLFGVGGVFFTALMVPARPPSVLTDFLMTALGAGVIGGLLLVAFQGLDVLGKPASAIFDPTTWAAAFKTTFGTRFVLGEISLVLAALAISLKPGPAQRGIATLGMIGVGAALAASGHASNAPPQQITWAAVFLHGVSAAFWVGSLAPLAILLLRRERSATAVLRSFSAIIPFAIIPLIGAGLLLSIVQLRRVSDLWATSYGLVLSAKLTLVLMLFVLASVNRIKLTAPTLTGEAQGRTRLTRSIYAEVALMVVIVGLVAGWRQTPPPRSMVEVAVTKPIEVMPMSTDGLTMANVTVEGTSGKRQVTIQVTDKAMTPITVKEVELSFENKALGIGPIVRQAKSDGGVWRVDDMPNLPSGRWSLGLRVLKSEFESAELTGETDIR